MPMELRSPVIAPGGTIPKAHTCEGENHAPPLAWSGIPDGAVTLVVTCDDPDAPRGVFRHWALYNIPATATGLAAGEGAGDAAVNDFGKPGYAGPCPPRGDPPHRYVFRLAALGGRLDPDPSARCADIARRARPLELASAALVGTFGR
jgi:Raf kinase inhibitor-like YbhB/YbcL family protein